MASSTVAIAPATNDRREWSTARRVQQQFMRHPAPAAGAVDHSAECRQVYEVGGDCYDFVPLGDNRLALTVGDASGKGMAAALMMASVQASLRTAAMLAGEDAAAMFRTVNRHVHATSLADRYATLFYGVYDGSTRTLRYVNAGHPPAIVVRRDGSLDFLECGGAPVGMFPDWLYEEGVVQLRPGDVVVACTDGVIEAENPSGELWGVERLVQVASENRTRSAAELVQAIFKSMDEFSQGTETDDATVVVLQIH